MKTLLKSLSIVCVLALTNCTSKQNTDLTQIEIDKIGDGVTVSTTDVFTNPRIVPLETSEQSLIGTMAKIIVKHNHIYVADSKGVYKFTNEGKFVARIIKAGRASHEYAMLNDFQIDDDDNVFVFSMTNNCIYKYDWDANFLSKAEIKPFADVNSLAVRFQLVNNENFALYLGPYGNNFYYGVVFVDSEGNIIGKSIPYTKERKAYFAMMENMNFSQNEHNTFFYQRFNDTIYVNDGSDHFVSLYHVDFKSNAVPNGYYNDKYSNSGEFVEKISDAKYATGIELFIETPTSYFLSYACNRNYYRALVSKRNRSQLVFENINESVYLRNYTIVNNKKWGLFPQPDNSIAIPLYPEKIMDYARANHLSQDDIEAIGKAISYSGIDQNPVIFIANIK